MLTIIESGSKAWAFAATNGDVRIFSREEVGEWSELVLSEGSEQLDGDGSLILEALYEQHAAMAPEEEPEAVEPEPRGVLAFRRMVDENWMGLMQCRRPACRVTNRTTGGAAAAPSTLQRQRQALHAPIPGRAPPREWPRRDTEAAAEGAPQRAGEISRPASFSALRSISAPTGDRRLSTLSAPKRPRSRRWPLTWTAMRPTGAIRRRGRADRRPRPTAPRSTTSGRTGPPYWLDRPGTHQRRSDVCR